MDWHPIPVDFLIGVAASYGFLWIFDGFLWISVDSHPIPCDFFMRCGRFLWISFDFLWISLDFYVPVVAVELLHISWDLVRRSAAEHARDVHHRASRKLDESVLLGCLAISVFMDSVGILSDCIKL